MTYGEEKSVRYITYREAYYSEYYFTISKPIISFWKIAESYYFINHKLPNWQSFQFLPKCLLGTKKKRRKHAVCKDFTDWSRPSPAEGPLNHICISMPRHSFAILFHSSTTKFEFWTSLSSSFPYPYVKMTYIGSLNHNLLMDYPNTLWFSPRLGHETIVYHFRNKQENLEKSFKLTHFELLNDTQRSCWNTFRELKYGRFSFEYQSDLNFDTATITYIFRVYDSCKISSRGRQLWKRKVGRIWQ